MLMILSFRHVVAEGSVVRQVICERCQHSYAYMLARKAALDVMPPTARLIASAEKTCCRRVEKRLANDHDPVSCPKCCWVQRNMVGELRRRFLRPIGRFGGFFSCGGAVLALASFLVGLLIRRQPSLDVNWFAIAGVSACGAIFGVLLLGIQMLLGRLRYSSTGFVSRHPHGQNLLIQMRAAA